MRFINSLVKTNSPILCQLRNPETNQSIDIIDTIEANLVDINVQDAEGNSALHLAFKCGNFWAAAVLYYHGAKVNCFNSRREEPLSCIKEERDRKLFSALFYYSAEDFRWRPLRIAMSLTENHADDRPTLWVRNENAHTHYYSHALSFLLIYHNVQQKKPFSWNCFSHYPKYSGLPITYQYFAKLFQQGYLQKHTHQTLNESLYALVQCEPSVAEQWMQYLLESHLSELLASQLLYDFVLFNTIGKFLLQNLISEQCEKIQQLPGLYLVKLCGAAIFHNMLEALEKMVNTTQVNLREIYLNRTEGDIFQAITLLPCKSAEWNSFAALEALEALFPHITTKKPSEAEPPMVFSSDSIEFLDQLKIHRSDLLLQIDHSGNTLLSHELGCHFDSIPILNWFRKNILQHDEAYLYNNINSLRNALEYIADKAEKKWFLKHYPDVFIGIEEALPRKSKNKFFKQLIQRAIHCLDQHLTSSQEVSLETAQSCVNYLIAKNAPGSIFIPLIKAYERQGNLFAAAKLLTVTLASLSREDEDCVALRTQLAAWILNGDVEVDATGTITKVHEATAVVTPKIGFFSQALEQQKLFARALQAYQFTHDILEEPDSSAQTMKLYCEHWLLGRPTPTANPAPIKGALAQYKSFYRSERMLSTHVCEQLTKLEQQTEFTTVHTEELNALKKELESHRARIQALEAQLGLQNSINKNGCFFG